MDVELSALLNVFGGCCGNVYVLEKLIRRFHECGELLTFAQYVVIALISLAVLVYRQKLSSAVKPSKIRSALVPSVLAFVVASLNNYVWVYKISVPLHTIIRSSGTVMALLIGAAQGKKYSLQQLAGVFLITVGTTISTLSRPSPSSTYSETSLVGVAILFFATFLAAVQTSMSSRSPLETDENMFLTHLLPLPLFFLTSGRINSQWASMDHSAVRQLLMTCVTQYICLLGVFMLFKFGAVTVNVTLSVRKFVSLLFSALKYRDVSNSLLFSGVLVFAGAGFYSTASSPASSSSRVRNKSAKQKKD